MITYEVAGLDLNSVLWLHPEYPLALGPKGDSVFPDELEVVVGDGSKVRAPPDAEVDGGVTVGFVVEPRPHGAGARERGVEDEVGVTGRAARQLRQNRRSDLLRAVFSA